MNEPTIYEHAHLAYFGSLGWKIDKAEYQSDKPIEFGKHGQGPIGTANDWQDAIEQILKIEGIRSYGMSNYCLNCGSSVHYGACTNCDEVIFIAEQYHEQNLPLPPSDSDFGQELHEAEIRQGKRLRGESVTE